MSNQTRGFRRWWVTKLHSTNGTTYPQTKRPEVTNADIDEIPWGADNLIVATLDYSDHWPLAQPWVIRTIAHWCREHCDGKWHLGELDHVYFDDTSDAMLFLMKHSRPPIT